MIFLCSSFLIKLHAKKCEFLGWTLNVKYIRNLLRVNDFGGRNAVKTVEGLLNGGRGLKYCELRGNYEVINSELKF